MGHERNSDESNLMIQTILNQAIAQAGGVLPFHQFMQQALYHPQHGYYMTQRPRLGRQGDFVTAPEMTSLFGELLTLQCIEIWQRLDCPARFQVVEAGAGSGKLAMDILRTAHRFPAFREALTYTILEVSPDFQARQQQTLEEAGISPHTLHWIPDLSSLPESSIEGILFSNEFLDAFPVHWVEMTQDGLREIAVTQGARNFETTKIPCAPPVDPHYFSTLGIDLPVGRRTEIGLASVAWMVQAGRVLKRGVILSIDYGCTQEEYYGPAFPQGTLTGFYQHQQINNPLRYPGAMDLTAHVNFSAMARAGASSGMVTLGYTTQAWFLMGLGILQRMEMLAKSQESALHESLRQTVSRLIMPQGMGERFKVLAQGKGVTETPLAGFSLNNKCQRLSLRQNI